MIQRIEARKPKQVDFRNHLHARTPHVQHDRLATVLDGSTRGIYARHRHRTSGSIPLMQGVKARECQQRAPTIRRDHRYDRHLARLIGRESIFHLDLVGNRNHGDDHPASAHGLDELVRITGASDHLIRGAIIVGKMTGSCQMTPITHHRLGVLPWIHAMSLSGTITVVCAASSRTRSTGAILSVVVLVAINLRLALSSLPAVATSIQAETGWSDAFIGALTTVPVLAMGLFALSVPTLAERIGRRRAVSMALATMSVALILRYVGAVAITLFISVLLAGIAIAILGGLVPGVVREQLSGSMGKATALWTAAMMGGAAIGAAATLPLATLLGGWNAALAFWALPAVVALVAWSVLERAGPAHDRPSKPMRLRDLPWRTSTAWALTGFMTLNSIVFYSALAWIAPSYSERGYSPETAGLLFGVFTGSQVLGALVLPRWSATVRHRRLLFSATVVLASGSLACMALLPHVAPVLVLMIFAFNLSGGFAMALGLLSEFADDAKGSTELTAMAFFVTYCVAAFGPLLAGVTMDAFDSWTLIYLVLALVTLTKLATVPYLKSASSGLRRNAH